MIPQIKEAFVGSEHKYKIYMQYPFGFCSDVSFMGTIISRKWHILFVLSLLISYLKFVFLLFSLLETNWYLFIATFRRFFSFYEWKQLFRQTCSAKYQTYLENQLNNFWTWNNSILMKYHTGNSAGQIRIIWANFGGKCLVFRD
jgi:hypothetical protein